MVPKVRGGGTLAAVPDILIASDADWVHEEIGSVLAGGGTSVRAVRTGVEVLPAVHARQADLVILDLQIGNMGGMAVCLELRLESGAGRLDHVPVLMLLDRRADVFLARRSGAEGWLLKPLDPIRLRRATGTLLRGGTYFDDSYLPIPVLVAPRSDSIPATGK
jgi:DNA-binding response OmpR family regulator